MNILKNYYENTLKWDILLKEPLIQNPLNFQIQITGNWGLKNITEIDFEIIKKILIWEFGQILKENFAKKSIHVFSQWKGDLIGFVMRFNQQKSLEIIETWCFFKPYSPSPWKKNNYNRVISFTSNHQYIHWPIHIKKQEWGGTWTIWINNFILLWFENEK